MRTGQLHVRVLSTWNPKCTSLKGVENADESVYSWQLFLSPPPLSNPLGGDVCGQNSAVPYFPTGVIPLL